MTTASDRGCTSDKGGVDWAADDVAELASLLGRHLNPKGACETLLAGPTAASLATVLTSRADDHRFTSVADAQDFLTGAAEPSPSRQQICLVDAFNSRPDCRTAVLAALRDRYGCRILHFERSMQGDNAWQLTDSLALGYRCIDNGHLQQTRWALFEFNLLSYKTTPDWLNSDHWCHPEQWDQSRW